MTSPPTIEDIREAASRIAGKIHHTPLWRSTTLGDRVGAELWLKCESFQKTGSFKARGALNKVLTLSADERGAGLITVSAGNHAGAVAWAARQVEAPCAVVMPNGAPQSKIDAVRGYGAEVILHPDRATLFDKLEEERAARGATFVHPFDDPVVIAGAGTTGLEIVEDLPDVDIVVVPIGGGGIMSGVTLAVKALRPDARVVAVELADGPGMQPALDAGEPVPVQRPATLADGMTPPFVGALPMQICRDHVDQLIGVTENEMIEAMRLLFTRCKLYVEASGAAATAALLAGRVDIPAGAKITALVSGGNVDLQTLTEAIGPTPSDTNPMDERRPEAATIHATRRAP